MSMSWQMASLLLLGGSTVLLFVGMPVAISFIAINLIGAILFLGGDAGLHQVARNSVAAAINFSLTPIPLFILMGEVLFHTGLALKVIDGVERLIRQVPGRLAVVAVVAGTIFSAISGSTIATTAMLGSLMLPVMLSRGYNPVLATGPIMAIGAVDMLIPPSALTVLLGSLSGISISKLLIGGVVPGLILSVAFVGYIVVRVHDAARACAGNADRKQNRLGPLRVAFFLRPAAGLDLRRRDRRDVGRNCNADRIGGVGRACDHGAGGRLSRAHLRKPAASAARHRRNFGDDPVHHPRRDTFSQILSFSGATQGIVSAILGQGLSTFAILAGMMLLLIFLGIFVDQVSMMLITLPVFMPIVQRLDIDLIWFGVLYLICMQLGLLLPPHGLLLMTMKGVAPPQVTMAHIFRAVVPYIAMSIVLLLIIIAFPAIATWLPNLLG